MDAFERNKYNELSYIKSIIAESIIVSYGFITAVEFDGVVVTLSVSNSGSAERVKCTFMNLGFEGFSISMRPEVGMRVLVLSPNKSAEGMYESYDQINIAQGREYILTGTAASYSSQTAMCIPVMKSTVQALNSLIIDSTSISAELKYELLVALHAPVEIDLMSDTNIELHEGTEHFRGCYGNMEQTFGFLQGIEGTEKPGEYVYKETYGKYSSVEKNYESGMDLVIGKAYEKPFLDAKGALLDSSAPVTLTFGKKAPINMDASAPITINLGTDAPVTLTFGESALVISADITAGFSVAVTGPAEIALTAEAGMLNIGNTTGSLLAIFSDLITAIEALVTVGGPTTQTIAPATVAALEVVKTKIAMILK